MGLGRRLPFETTASFAVRILRVYYRPMASAEQQPDSMNIRLLVDSIPALIHTARPDGYLDYFNKPWLEYYGVTLDKVAGWNWTAYVHPDDVDGIVAKWRACLATGEIFEYETRVRRANGDYRWMFHRKVPLRDANGDILKWYGSSLDIDERKTAEEQLHSNAKDLRRSEFYLAEGQRLAHMGSWAFDPDGFYYWSPELFRMHGLDPAGKPPSVQEYLDGLHPHDRESMAGLIKKILTEDTPFDATKRIVRPDGEVRYIRCVGVSVAENQGLKKYVGSAIDVTEHELLTQELRRREAYLTEAQRLSHTGSFGWKPDPDEILWSDESYRIFEYERSVKPTIDSLAQRVHPEDRADVKEVINRAFAGATDFEHAYRLLMPDGRVKHVHAIAHVLQNASGSREFVGAVTDITEQRHAEAMIREREGELQENTAKLEEAQRVAHVGYWEWDLRTDHVSWSDETYRIYGLRPQERPIDVATIRESIHPEDREFVFREAAEAIQGEVRADVEHRIVRPSGEVRVVYSQGDLRRDAAGRAWQMFGTVQDITDRKRAEEKIREQDAGLRQILDLAPQHIGVFEPDGSPLYANRATLEYLGISIDRWRDETARDGLVHPDDRERFLRERKRRFLEGVSHEFETRLLGHDGKFRWFLFRLNPLKDELGQITRWYGTGIDIEERKQAEDRLRHENVALREEIDKASLFEEIVGTSPALKSVLSLISKVAPSDSTVLITGETGTGKELVARAIHRRSDRVSRAFVSVNCAAIPRDLIASELFGHEKGAFTGATQQRLGRFELANGGTIFLDEVGELPAETQIALLRVLQEHEFERVGGNRRIRADVRVIAATNRDLQAAISARSFRSDLFYRLNVFPIEIPSLRDRREDIPLLVEYFIDRYARKAGKNIKRVNKKTLELLQSYPWPGNIRELQNVIERSVILCETEIFSIDENWLPQQPLLTAEPKPQVELPRRLLVQEKVMIEAALKEARGRVSGPTGAAVKLGIPRSTLESKIRSLKINKNRFKSIPGT
jgi:PAS domain S-box-containing protein